MINAAALLADTRKLANRLVDDLRANADKETVDAEYSAAKRAGRTSLPLPQWAEGLYAQVAVSWVLGAVFVRFCEDNGLVTEAWLSGPGNRRDLARDRRADYLRQNPAHDDRHWLRHIYTTFANLPATGDVFGAHNPLWLLEPSADGARDIVQTFQQINPDSGEITHDFTDPSWDTRFLGDLYQDLSDHAKKQFALLQTPVFVEEFILDHTLEPAIKTFGLKDTDLIDPTCGSGHFLLGAFHRLFNKWTELEPGTNRRELARRAVDAVAGIDVNPFAAAIARFRLLIAALKAGGDRRLADAPTYPINIAVGDSLLHVATQLTLRGIGGENADVLAASAHGYSTEDLELTYALLNRQWAAVVGNPPYIVVRDPALNAIYRGRYATCHRQYSLGVPFTERFWQLARKDAQSPEHSGFIGMITANSFMKREFGKKLIEEWVPTHDITHLIDTSGAYIPGHGTPTVILFGRSRRPVRSTVRAVMGIRGEPSTPADPSKGLVWTSIVDHLDEPGVTTDFVSVVDLERVRLCAHPWSIGGGGAADLKDRLDSSSAVKLGALITEIGRTTHTGEDDVYLLDVASAQRVQRPVSTIRLVVGEEVRNWTIDDGGWALFPYSHDLGETIPNSPGVRQLFWPWRANLRARLNFGQTNEERGLQWWEYSMFFKHRFTNALSVTFSFVATHNHFVLDRGGKVFNRSAPVIKLPAGASEAEHLDLVGVLNSSTACFWMKQAFHDKGNGGYGGGIAAEAWERFYEFDGTKLQAFPLPSAFPRRTAMALDDLAQLLSAASPSSVASSEVPTPERLASAAQKWARHRAEMIGLQEQLDWECYHLYGLLDEALVLPEGEPPLELGQRAFEIVLARKVAAGDEATTWFARHGSMPITELPAHWSAEYRALVERRIEAIEANPEIGLIERPEYKRRWNTTPWEVQQADALRSWLLDRLETADYWPSASITTTARLSATARTDADFMTVARLYAGRDDVDVAALIADLVKAEAVPYLAALRYKDSGLRKWEQWCQTWALQRREDAGEDVGEIPVPPRYTSADFLGVAWTHRGKLDVPKERFISYPGAETGNDSSLVVGWAGWDHLERARALATWYLGLKRDGADGDRLTPLLAGLAEVLPWVLQWHNEPHPDAAMSYPGNQIRALLEGEMRQLGVTVEELERWRPAAPTRGRRKAT